MATLKTDSKTGIMYEHWEAASPQAIFLLVHGLGAHAGRWMPMAEYFQHRNIALYAIELKGFGRTHGIKGHIDSFDQYFDDIRFLARIIHTENPGTKVFLVGESFGGLLSFLLVHETPELFSGLICLSPAFSVKIQVSLWDYIWVLFNLYKNPAKQFKVRFMGEMCTRDQKYQEQLDTDFREHRLVSAQFILNYFYAERRARRIASRIPIPVLFLVPLQDKLVSPHASKIIFYRMDARDKQMIKYPEMFHALSVELDKEKVFEDILSWLHKRI